MQRAFETYAIGFNRDPRESIVTAAPDGVSAALWSQHLPERTEFANPAVEDCHVLSYRLAPVECRMEASGRVIHQGTSKPGSFSLIRAGDRPRAILSGEWRTMTIFLPTVIVDRVKADEAISAAYRQRDLQSDGSIDNPLLARCARDILGEMNDGLPLARMRIDCLGQDIAIQLLRLGTMRHGDADLPSGDGRLKRAQALIEDRLGADLGVAELAEAAGISAVHLTSLFRRATGLPPHKWIVQRRIERARSLLADTDLSVTEIALQCGFATSQHLALVFRRHLSATPTEYRRILRD